MARKKVTVSGSVLQFSVVIYREKDNYVALSPEFNVASQGDSVEEAKDLLKEAIELYISHPNAKIPTTHFVAVSSDIIESNIKNRQNCSEEDDLFCQ